MKYPLFCAKAMPLWPALTCLTAALLLSHCRGTSKGNLQTPPVLIEKNVTSNPKGNPSAIIPSIGKSAPPIGLWTEEEFGPYVSIEPRTKQPFSEEYEIPAGDLIISIGGPPNRKFNADDIFIKSKYVLEKNKLSMRGFFGWDQEKIEVDIEVTWTESSVTLQIFKNEKFTHYDAKRYRLKLRK